MKMMPDVWLTHVRVLVLYVLSPCIYRLDMISPCQTETLSRPRNARYSTYTSSCRDYGTTKTATDRDWHCGAADVGAYAV